MWSRVQSNRSTKTLAFGEASISWPLSRHSNRTWAWNGGTQWQKCICNNNDTNNKHHWSISEYRIGDHVNDSLQIRCVSQVAITFLRKWPSGFAFTAVSARPLLVTSAFKSVHNPSVRLRGLFWGFWAKLTGVFSRSRSPTVNCVKNLSWLCCSIVLYVPFN